jgi:hypothetical protein
LYSCPHARQLWDAMRGIWYLPSDVELRSNMHVNFGKLLRSRCVMLFCSLLGELGMLVMKLLILNLSLRYRVPSASSLAT